MIFIFKVCSALNLLPLRQRTIMRATRTAVLPRPNTTLLTSNESYFLGDNETLFAWYLTASQRNGTINSKTLFLDDPDSRVMLRSLWESGQLVVSDREAWRALRGGGLVLNGDAEAQVADGAKRAANLWAHMGTDVASARRFLDSVPFDVGPDTLQEFLDYFKDEFPYYRGACDVCGEPASTCVGEISCVGDDVEHRRANKAELRICHSCGSLIRFVRSNNVDVVLQDKRGRCGEYSTAMMAIGVALGYESRLIFDSTDHVWVELKMGDRWVHCDPCEAALDQPGLYRSWGKNGSLVIAFERQRAEDVTLDYYPDHLAVNDIRRKAKVDEAQLKSILDSYYPSLLKDSTNSSQR